MDYNLQNEILPILDSILEGDSEKAKKIISKYESEFSDNTYSLIFKALDKLSDKIEKSEKNIDFSYESSHNLTQNISERKNIENRLKESINRFNDLAIQSRTISWEVDKNGLYTYISPNVKEIWGYTPEEIIGKMHFYDLHPEEFREKYKQEGIKLINSRESIKNYENPITTKDGSEIWVLSFGLSLTDDNNKVIGFRGSDMDITERKRREEEIRSYSIELETMNEELRNSKEIIETNLNEKNLLIDELTTAREQLEKLNSEKDKFFSIIAHDLKSPFSGFLNLTKILVEDFNKLTISDVNEIMSDLNSSANNLYKLLENLLEWSRMQRGSMSFNPVSANMYYLTNSNIEIKAEIAKHKEISIINNIGRQAEVIADVSMINTLLRNLLSNAIKFTERGGRIEVGTIANKSNNNYITFFVKDNGIGMSESLKNKLFKIDEKVSRIGTEDEPSTGLGLLLCKEFIDKHEGSLWAESEEDKGSTFYFTLPK